MKTILDPTFKYKPSFATDIRKTFEKARRAHKPASVKPADRPVVILAEAAFTKRAVGM